MCCEMFRKVEREKKDKRQRTNWTHIYKQAAAARDGEGLLVVSCHITSFVRHNSASAGNCLFQLPLTR